jgi:hypothetical protein
VLATPDVRHADSVLILADRARHIRTRVPGQLRDVAVVDLRRGSTWAESPAPGEVRGCP